MKWWIFSWSLALFDEDYARSHGFVSPRYWGIDFRGFQIGYWSKGTTP